MIEFVKYKRTT